jgi:hypothetical protein
MQENALFYFYSQYLFNSRYVANFKKKDEHIQRSVGEYGVVATTQRPCPQ